MDIALVHARIDHALSANRRAEKIIIYLALAIFALGVGALLFAYRHTNPYIASGSVLTQAFLYGPIFEIRRLRRENLSLQTVPALVAGLSPADARTEIRTLLAFIRGK
jgi:hypothetical protein